MAGSWFLIVRTSPGRLPRTDQAAAAPERRAASAHEARPPEHLAVDGDGGVELEVDWRVTGGRPRRKEEERGQRRDGELPLHRDTSSRLSRPRWIVTFQSVRG